MGLQLQDRDGAMINITMFKPPKRPNADLGQLWRSLSSNTTTLTQIRIFNILLLVSEKAMIANILGNVTLKDLFLL